MTRRTRNTLLAAGILYLLALHAVVVILVFKTNFLLLAGKTLGLIPPEEWSLALTGRILEQADDDRSTRPGSLILIGDSLMAQLDPRLVSDDAVNDGIGGDTTRTLNARLPVLRAIAASRMVVAEIGVNDLKYRPPAEIERDYAILLRRLPPPGPLVLISVLPVNEAGPAARQRPYLRNRTIRDLNQRIARLCADRPACTYLDAWPVLSGPDAVRFYGPDGWHLSQSGNVTLAGLLRPLVRR